MPSTRTPVLAALIALVALTPATGSAATVTVRDGIIVYVADDGANGVFVDCASAETCLVWDAFTQDAPQVAAGVPCIVRAEPARRVVDCSGTALRGIEVDLGAGDDILDASGAFTAPSRATVVPLTVRGGPGADQVWGGVGDDRLMGDEGNDTMFGMEGRNTLEGGVGTDLLTAGGPEEDVFVPGPSVLIGGDGDDSLVAGPGADSLDGGSGADRLTAGPGADVLTGGDGNDVMFGGGGADRFDGGEGADQVVNGFGLGIAPNPDAVVADLGPGSDRFDSVGLAADTIVGGDGGDSINAGCGADRVDGGPGNDRLRDGDEDCPEGAGPFDDVLDAGDGNDRVEARGCGRDVVDAGPGDDYLLLAPCGAKRIAAGAGDDYLIAGPGLPGGVVDLGPGRDTAVMSQGKILARDGEADRVSCRTVSRGLIGVDDPVTIIADAIPLDSDIPRFCPPPRRPGDPPRTYRRGQRLTEFTPTYLSAISPRTRGGVFSVTFRLGAPRGRVVVDVFRRVAPADRLERRVVVRTFARGRRTIRVGRLGSGRWALRMRVLGTSWGPRTTLVERRVVVP